MILPGLFDWKRMCAGFFYRLFVSKPALEIEISGWGREPINQLNPATWLCLSQALIWMSYAIYSGLLCVHWFEVRGLLILVELLTITVLTLFSLHTPYFYRNHRLYIYIYWSHANCTSNSYKYMIRTRLWPIGVPRLMKLCPPPPEQMEPPSNSAASVLNSFIRGIF